MVSIPTFEDIERAAGRLAGFAVRTPLLRSPLLSDKTGADVYLKPENLQRTGSFKFRGAFNAINALGDAAEPGIVACSSGNHAQGIAEAARLAGVPATIVMPADAPQIKKAGVTSAGGRIVDYDRVSEDRDAIADGIIAEEGGTLIHPYNNFHVIAGQGTVGLEIAEDCERLGIAPDHVLVPCGGGGLTAGIATAMHARIAKARVHPVEPAGFDDYGRSLKSGKRESNEKLGGSICDALLAPSPGEIGFEINRALCGEGYAVDDDDALLAVGFACRLLKLVLEPGGAVALAALMKESLPLAGKTCVVVLSGGNLEDDMLMKGLARYRETHPG
jgi:threonine dehydratase